MLEHLKKCDDKEKFPRFLPAGVTVAHKTGSVSDARTDAGILYFKGGPVAVVRADGRERGQAAGRPDNAGNKLCADVAKAVVEHYQPTQIGHAEEVDLLATALRKETSPWRSR